MKELPIHVVFRDEDYEKLIAVLNYYDPLSSKKPPIAPVIRHIILKEYDVLVAMGKIK